ncbi:BTAD domain-containing putative transcriptional regulator [Catenulispora yoronensis]|uniref:BTAD domain-containing putative transcriptional regulator n=1 Tax=Catenulispora yoronensis TaxID=450799 RepID=A0ABP5GM07_9ACTN
MLGAGQRTILAALLLHANASVSCDRLTDRVWDVPPTGARAALHAQVKRLRTTLGPTVGPRLLTVGSSYLIEVGPGELDVDRFRAEQRRGRDAGAVGRWSEAVDAYTAALALWRGEPLADVPGTGRRDEDTADLLELRWQTVVDRVSALLDLGRPGETIAELRSLIAAEPLRETPYRLLMTALYRTGRAAESLRVYQDLRRLLIEELGAEPSADTREVHARILDGEPLPPTQHPETALALGHATEAPAPAPRQLPAKARNFVGRRQELDQLLELAHAAAAEAANNGTVVISAIDGMAGVGKSTLAVHSTHAAAELFPDGQLYLDLRGHTPGVEPLDAETALEHLLRSLGVPHSGIPGGADARAALFRERLAGTRTLILLDDARNSAQVRPLIPGHAGCLLLVTSRRRLTGLDDAHQVEVAILPEAEAVALVRQVAGPGRIAEDHPGLAETIALCGRLPLALRIIGARLRHHPLLELDDVLADLRNERDRLGFLHDDDRDIRSVFHSSFRWMPAAEQRMFTLLGLVPGVDADAYAAASLAGLALPAARALLCSLAEYNLVAEAAPGRFRFHDLLALHARELAEALEPGERDDAVDRLFAYYRTAALGADQHVTRKRRSMGVDGAGSLMGETASAVGPRAASVPVPLPRVSGVTEAIEWLRKERVNLLAAVDYAAEHSRTRDVVALTAGLAGLLRRDGPREMGMTRHLAAAQAAHDDGDQAGEADALLEASKSGQLAGDFARSQLVGSQALALYRALGDPYGQLAALAQIGRAEIVSGRVRLAAHTLRTALAGFEKLGDAQGQADALWNLARIGRLSGTFAEAEQLCRRALALYGEVGDLNGKAQATLELGRIRECFGDLATAAEHYQTAASAFHDTGSHNTESSALFELGRMRRAAGRRGEAREYMERAVTLARTYCTPVNVSTALRELADLSLAENSIPEAIGLLEQALSICLTARYPNGEANTRHVLGRALMAAGEIRAADSHLRQALTLARKVGSAFLEAEVLTTLGTLAMTTGDNDEGLRQLNESLTIARGMNAPHVEARALEARGGSLLNSGAADDRAEGLADLRQAVEIFRRIGFVEREQAVDALIRAAGGGTAG